MWIHLSTTSKYEEDRFWLVSKFVNAPFILEFLSLILCPLGKAVESVASILSVVIGPLTWSRLSLIGLPQTGLSHHLNGPGCHESIVIRATLEDF